MNKLQELKAWIARQSGHLSPLNDDNYSRGVRTTASSITDEIDRLLAQPDAEIERLREELRILKLQADHIFADRDNLRDLLLASERKTGSEIVATKDEIERLRAARTTDAEHEAAVENWRRGALFRECEHPATGEMRAIGFWLTRDEIDRAVELMRRPAAKREDAAPGDDVLRKELAELRRAAKRLHDYYEDTVHDPHHSKAWVKLGDLLGRGAGCPKCGGIMEPTGQFSRTDPPEPYLACRKCDPKDFPPLDREGDDVLREFLQTVPYNLTDRQVHAAMEELCRRALREASDGR